MRGTYGKYLLEIFTLGYFLKGVHEPKKDKNVRIDSFEKYIKDWGISVDNNSAHGFCKTDRHKIEYDISVLKKGNHLCISLNPVIIKVLGHDLSVDHTFFPVVGSKSKKRGDGKLSFDGFSIIGDFRDVVYTDDFTAVDQTLSTNWTQGGIYKGKFEILLHMKK